MALATASVERTAIVLATATIVWNVIEGCLAIGLGLADESIALLGFGLDSWVEVASGFVVLHQLRTGMDPERERSAARWVSGLLFGLGVVMVLGAGLRLGTGSAPSTGLPGVVLGAVSLSFMFTLWRAKLGVARELNSRTLELDAACSRGCIQLSVVLLFGSALYALVPSLWWADAVAAAVLGFLIAREGREGWQHANSPGFDGGCCGA